MNEIKNKIPFFIHIPKSGGSLVKSTLQNHGIKYKTYPYQMGHFTVNNSAVTQFGKLNDWKSWVNKNHFFFTVVRNPFDLFVSWYYHSGPRFQGWGKCVSDHGNPSFEKFIENYCCGDFVFKDFQNSCYGQLFDRSGVYVPKITIRNEFLNTGFPTMLKWCGLVQNESQVRWATQNRNTSKLRQHKDYRKYYTPKMIDMVNRKCAFELTTFGYSFDGPVDDKPIIVPAWD